jgi:hypothetical protein
MNDPCGLAQCNECKAKGPMQSPAGEDSVNRQLELSRTGGHTPGELSAPGQTPPAVPGAVCPSTTPRYRVPTRRGEKRGKEAKSPKGLLGTDIILFSL